MVSATKGVEFALILISLPGEFIFERGIGYPFTFMHEFSDGDFEDAWDGLNPQAGTFTTVHLDDYWERVTFGVIGESRGLEWGHRWKSIDDKPHF
jgi:hypothetical protein